MDPFTLTLLVIIGLALLGLPIGLSMISGSVVYLFMNGMDMGLVAERLLNSMLTGYVILAVPLFILAAELMNIGSMTNRLLHFCNALVGRFRGGLGYVNIVQSIIFSGMSGSAFADAAGTGRIIANMMIQDGRYTRSFAAALTASAAVIGPIIPPSIPMVLYALVSNASIGYLFLGGIIPGLLMGAMLMSVVMVTARRRKFPVEAPTPVRQLPGITLRAFPALMLPVVLLGGIYSGAMTPTEAAAVAAAYAFLISILLYRNINARQVFGSLVSSARSSVAIGMLIAGALVFNYVVTSENIPQALSLFLTDYDLTVLQFLLMVNIVLLLLGCLLEGTAIILIIVPVFIPTANALGVDLVHFGVIAVVNIMIGLVTPPYGLLIFIMQSITRAPLRSLFLDLVPFIAALLVSLAMITLFPDIVLWLPRQFGYDG
ncbi:TRAP transporter large permease [Halomonas urumqiensis]|uniref:TRAP transporter large permease protein n=1 Tax=Halomonas urumqiensis TaxID=1684789 RepID=A0A2N7UNJ6_9GAMM|nr:TRAP transporter large permease [Halomonas urumqiensis]PMR82015.1 permease [Halomonas urumqiensis]PTB02653.1 TRAP transporter large permease [Halomonas urumqiensis]GHE21139.1 permease [Halomonas urumqiensis]